MAKYLGIITRCRQEVQNSLVQKRLHHIAPELKPVPNPLSLDYLLMVQQCSRLTFVDSVEVLKAESGVNWWLRLAGCFVEYLRLKATTAIIASMVLENQLTQRSGNVQK